MKLYFAARYSRRRELLIYREATEQLGHQVVARWLDGDHQIADSDLEMPAAPERVLALARRYALDDIEDLAQCDACVVFTEPPRSSRSRGGRFVEMGLALGLGLEIFIVGPRENAFCALESRGWLESERYQFCLSRYDDWQAFVNDVLNHRTKGGEEMNERESGDQGDQSAVAGDSAAEQAAGEQAQSQEQSAEQLAEQAAEQAAGQAAGEQEPATDRPVTG